MVPPLYHSTEDRMSDTVKVRTMRMHFGDFGHKVEGDEYETSKAHAEQLTNLKLVEIVGEVDAKAEPAPDNKSETVPENKGAASTETPPAKPTTETPVTETPATEPKKRNRQRAAKGEVGRSPKGPRNEKHHG
jgi:hypothetical protein